MERIYLNELKEYYGKEVEVSGFVENIRDLQWVQFVILKDYSGKVQITIEKSEEKNKEIIFFSIIIILVIFSIYYIVQDFLGDFCGF